MVNRPRVDAKFGLFSDYIMGLSLEDYEKEEIMRRFYDVIQNLEIIQGKPSAEGYIADKRRIYVLKNIVDKFGIPEDHYFPSVFCNTIAYQIQREIELHRRLNESFENEKTNPIPAEQECPGTKGFAACPYYLKESGLCVQIPKVKAYCPFPYISDEEEPLFDDL